MRRNAKFIPIILFLAIGSFFSLFVTQSQALGETDRAKRKPEVSAKSKFSFGYDNNVSERKEEQTESRFYQFYMTSDMHILPTERTSLYMKLQDGLKYLDAPSLSDESVLISDLSLYLSHGFSERVIPEIQGKIGGRTSIHSDSGTLPSEEAYLNGLLGASLKAMLLSDIMGRAFAQYKFTNFEDFDPFDRRATSMGLRADVRLLPNATASVQYFHDTTRYNKWEFDPSDGKTSRLDTTDEISLFAQFCQYFLFDMAYSYQKNESDIDEYSYRANKVSLLMARNFPLDLMFQLYALVRFKKYQATSKESTSEQLDLEDDERRALTIKLSKDIGESSVLEAQYDLRRSSSYEENGLYTKSVFSLSLSFHF